MKNLKGIDDVLHLKSIFVISFEINHTLSQNFLCELDNKIYFKYIYFPCRGQSFLSYQFHKKYDDSINLFMI